MNINDWDDFKKEFKEVSQRVTMIWGGLKLGGICIGCLCGVIISMYNSTQQSGQRRDDQIAVLNQQVATIKEDIILKKLN